MNWAPVETIWKFHLLTTELGLMGAEHPDLRSPRRARVCHPFPTKVRSVGSGAGSKRASEGGWAAVLRKIICVGGKVR